MANEQQTTTTARDRTDRQATTIRTCAGWLLLGTAAVLVFTQALGLAQSGIPEVTAGGTVPQPLFSLSGLVVIGAPLLAVVTALKAGEPVPSARAVTLVATGCYVVTLLLSVFLVTGGVRMFAPQGFTVAMVRFVMMEVLLLGLLVLAAAYVDNLRRALCQTVEEPAIASDVR
jgi:hypothetical protein